MKRTAGIIASVCAIVMGAVLLLCGCTDWKPERPKDTNLEFWIVDDVGGYDWSAHELTKMPWGGGGYYYGSKYRSEYLEDGTKIAPEYYVEYHIYNWPDLADRGGYITNIYITDPEITVYRLTVNSTFEEFRKVFERKGYEVEIMSLKEKNDTITAYRSGFGFTLGKLKGVNKFRIGARVTNNTGILF